MNQQTGEISVQREAQLAFVNAHADMLESDLEKLQCADFNLHKSFITLPQLSRVLIWDHK